MKAIENFEYKMRLYITKTANKSILIQRLIEDNSNPTSPSVSVSASTTNQMIKNVQTNAVSKVPCNLNAADAMSYADHANKIIQKNITSSSSFGGALTKNIEMMEKKETILNYSHPILKTLFQFLGREIKSSATFSYPNKDTSLNFNLNNSANCNKVNHNVSINNVNNNQTDVVNKATSTNVNSSVHSTSTIKPTTASTINSTSSDFDEINIFLFLMDYSHHPLQVCPSYRSYHI